MGRAKRRMGAKAVTGEQPPPSVHPLWFTPPNDIPIQGSLQTIGKSKASVDAKFVDHTKVSPLPFK